MRLNNEAFHLVRLLFQKHTAQWQQHLPTLTKPQYAVLRAIVENPGINQVALMEAAVSTKATLAEMLSRMEKRGLVKRRNDPLDKRRRLVFPSAQGEALLTASLSHSTGVDDAFLDKLSPDERTEFTRLIIKMMA